MAPERWSARGHIRLGALAALVLVLIIPSSAQSGQKGWRLCNRTSYIVEAATGRPDGLDVIVEGWKRLRPGDCELAAPAPLESGAHFVYARSSKAHRGAQSWSGRTPLCVDVNGSFAIENPSSCSSMGLEERGFMPVRIEGDGGAITFTETELYDKASQSPQSAGIQRLPSTPVPQLIDVLEDVANRRARQVGMELCNRTDKRILAAMARSRPDGLESRGWWMIDANQCVRAVDESLITAPHYVFAEMATPEGVRTLSGATTIFCTSRAQFAILGNENCEQRRYRQERFVETAPPEDGKLVYQFFESAFSAPQPP